MDAFTTAMTDFRIKQRILLVEDDRGDAYLASDRLAEEPFAWMEIVHVDTLGNALAVLGAQEVDAIVLDLSLPDSQGIETIRRTRRAAPEVPIIVVTGLVDENLRIDAIHAGADEILGKNETNTSLFSRAILYVVQRTQARQQNRQLEMLLESTPDGIIVISQSGVVRYVNQSALTLFGRSREEILGELIGFSVRDGEPLEISIPRRGDPRVAELRVVQFDWRGEPGYLASMRDVTELRTVETQLRQAQKMEAIGQLTGGMAHDFNNLLTIIIGNSDLLARRIVTDDTAKRLAETTLSAAQRAAGLTAQLLAFARRQPLDLRVADVNVIVGQMSTLLQRTLGEDVEIATLPAEDLWLTEIDPGQLEAAVLNLAVNARNAMPEGGRLTIETANVTLDRSIAARMEVEIGEYIVVAVSDTGCGMSEEVLAKAFEPFFTTHEPGAGTGLGLSMVYGFSKQSGGYARIYSEVGQGTTVKLYLPRAQAGAEKTAEEDQATAKVLVGTERVLVVEDDDLVRPHVEAQLLSFGYSVVAVGDGTAALDLLAHDSGFDVMITDVVMPGVNGQKLAEEAHKIRPGLPVLFTSGYPEGALAHQGRLDIGVELLSKPYRPSDLAARLRRVIDRAERKDARGETPEGDAKKPASA